MYVSVYVDVYVDVYVHVYVYIYICPRYVGVCTNRIILLDGNYVGTMS